jgi:hypothetical protein
MGVSGQRHAPAMLYPRGKDTDTHWTEGWVGPTAGQDTGFVALVTSIQDSRAVFVIFIRYEEVTEQL